MLRSGVGLVIFIALLLQLCSSLAVPPAAGAGALPGAAPAPTAAAQLSAAERGRIETLIREAEYQATPRARPDGQAAFWAPNRAHKLSLDFGPAGLDVTPGAGDDAWSLSVRATAYGPAGARQPLPISARGCRVR